MLVSGDDNPTKVSIHHLGAQPSQPTDQLLKQLRHQAINHSMQQRVRQKAVAVAAQVAVDRGEDRVGNTRSAVSVSASRGGRGGAVRRGDFFDALGNHRFEDAAVK